MTILYLLVTLISIIHIFTAHSADNQSPHPFAAFDVETAKSIILPHVEALGTEENVLLLDNDCPFTMEIFRDLIKKAKDDDTFVFVTSYQCASEDSNIANKIRHADGGSLLNWFFQYGTYTDPRSNLPIAQSHYYECTYQGDELIIQYLGNLQQARTKGTYLNQSACYAVMKVEEELCKMNGTLESRLKAYNLTRKSSILACIYNARLMAQKKDINRACKWYKQALEDPIAMVELGNLYRKNNQSELAIPLLEKAVKSDTLKIMQAAAAILGNIYHDKGNLIKEREWLLINAQTGRELSMFRLGTSYRLEGNMEQAIHWHRESAKTGSVAGMLSLLVDIHMHRIHTVDEHELIEYANKVATTLNKKEACSEPENYVLHFKATHPDEYQKAVEMLKKYCTDDFKT